jgi:phosphatidylserine decarboxylase
MLSVVSVRQVFIIQLDGSDKLIAVIEIGMAEVSGCHPTVIEGQHVNKGDELGYFAFGGSSYAMIFDKDFDLTFKKDVFAINCKSDGGELQTCKQYVNSLLCTFA